MTDHERRARCPFGASVIEKLSDRFADQRLIACTMPVAELKSGHCRSSRHFAEIIALNRAGNSTIQYCGGRRKCDENASAVDLKFLPLGWKLS
jgi:hypothetical protein